MTEGMYLAVIAAGSAILASAVTGFFIYFTAVRQREADRYKRRLLQTYKDIIAFYRLEEQYTQALAVETKSAEAVKREIRKKLRELGVDSPSEDATPQQCDRRIKELS
jgi:putative intracellular protease/amidase